MRVQGIVAMRLKLNVMRDCVDDRNADANDRIVVVNIVCVDTFLRLPRGGLWNQSRVIAAYRKCAQ